MAAAALQKDSLGLLALRVRNEFLEMPGLCLTERQARRLWNLCTTDCEQVLAALLEAGFLKRTKDGSFVRSTPPN